MIGQNLSKLLKTTKNLLAFSGGVDSSALFFALLEARVEFDIAIVDYNERASSKDEVAYAASLAEKYGKKIYQHSASLGTSDFENSARKVRHQFFEKIIKENNYAVLLTAHQLNDRLEWFLMRFTVGAGVNSLVGMREIDERDGYIIVRPLLGVSRDEIVDFLTKKSITYFEDESNLDERFTRNAFRNRHSNELVSSFSTGIKRSFEILEQESDFLYGKTKIFQQEELYIIEISNSLQLLYSLDYIAKKFGSKR
jgi:tRNA(Ile)-lysidine synthase